MSRIAYVNGRYVPHANATVHVEDRGYQFADGVYEVVTVVGRHLVDEIPHLDRFDRSLGELAIARPMHRNALRQVMREVVRRNHITDGLLYIQATRGVARRNHAFPGAAVKPSLVMTARPTRLPGTEVLDTGVRVVTVPDIRWLRRDIKSVSLLPNVLAKQAAIERGAFEAWMFDENDLVTEGSSSNAWIVTADNTIVTRQTGHEILTGITRQAVLAVAYENGFEFEQRAFSVAEAQAAREAFLTSATSFVMPVTQIDEHVIANGKPGSVTRALHRHYLNYIRSTG